MNDRQEPLFLARRSYRRRRVMDAARVLPWVGLVLFLLPVAWGAEAVPGTARVGLYVFGIWAGLIVASALLSRRLVRDAEAGADER